MDYELIRSSRKTLAITVDKNGKLIVRAPMKMPQETIDSFVNEKAQWIKKHTDAAEQHSYDRSSRLAVPPEALPFLGGMCPVKNITPYGYIDGCFNLPPDTSLEELIPYLRRLYAAVAKEALVSRTRLLADRMGVQISDIKINSARTRWGSCSSQKVINLSWKLLAADPKLIDYVIVHELCHTIHMNHSPAFWEMVGSVIPDYKERRQELKSVQKILGEFGLE
ncbi:MAG: M48 family metallopeptidase [Huintestinicola sp.]